MTLWLPLFCLEHLMSNLMVIQYNFIELLSSVISLVIVDDFPISLHQAYSCHVLCFTFAES